MPDLATQALGYITLALVVVGYLWWEWRVSTTDRARREEQRQELQGQR